MHRFLGLAVLFILSLSLLSHAIPTIKADGQPNLTEIKQAVQEAVNYVNKLTRHLDNYHAVVAEYPALPIVVIDPDGVSVGGSNGGIDVDAELHFVAGINLYVPNWGNTYTEVSFDNFEMNTYSDHTVYQWDTLLKLYVLGTLHPLAILHVTEYRSSDLGYVTIEVTNIYPSERYGSLSLKNAHIYIGGDYLCDVGDAIDSSFGITLPDPLPSMRFSVRHVNDLVSSVMYELDALTLDLMHVDSNVRYIQNTLLPLGNGYDKYDIYARSMPDEYDDQIKVYTEYICDNFFDARYWNDEIGYDKIYNWYSNLGFITTNYPAYPYKSKIVNAAELVHSGTSIIELITGDTFEATLDHGGWIFLNALSVVNDPLYYEYYALYYIQLGKYGYAYNEWQQIINHWDGTGIAAGWQNGYSTVRLALAISIGSTLYGKGYDIDKSLLDNMVNILLQLQWQGSGHYSPDGSNVYYIHKEDHKGGFLVSYGEIGSYGFVPFRPSLADEIFKITGGVMGDEYPGVLPTNTESTLLSLSALISYSYYVLGMPPNQLLQ